VSPEIPASKAILDTNAAMRVMIERANLAIIDVVKAGIKFDDPLLQSLLGIDGPLLDALGSADKKTMNTLCMTAVPIFSIRLAAPEFMPMLKGEGGADAALKMLLRSFPTSLPIRSI
jgi:hypothetical protein